MNVIGALLVGLIKLTWWNPVQPVMLMGPEKNSLRRKPAVSVQLEMVTLSEPTPARSDSKSNPASAGLMTFTWLSTDEETSANVTP